MNSRLKHRKVLLRKKHPSFKCCCSHCESACGILCYMLYQHIQTFNITKGTEIPLKRNLDLKFGNFLEVDNHGKPVFS